MSDVKMVEFAGFGHPAVYSRAAPYVDTDLAAGTLAESTAGEWRDALTGLLEDGWRRAAEEQAAVVAARSMEKVARECWYPALQAVRLPERSLARELTAIGNSRSFRKQRRAMRR